MLALTFYQIEKFENNCTHVHDEGRNNKDEQLKNLSPEPDITVLRSEIDI